MMDDDIQLINVGGAAMIGASNVIGRAMTVRDRVGRISPTLWSTAETAAARANAKVLLHPTAARAVVHSANRVASGVHDFHRLLGIESSRWSWSARPWGAAAAQARTKALGSGAPAAAGLALVGAAIAVKVLQHRVTRRAAAHG